MEVNYTTRSIKKRGKIYLDAVDVYNALSIVKLCGIGAIDNLIESINRLIHENPELTNNK